METKNLSREQILALLRKNPSKVIADNLIKFDHQPVDTTEKEELQLMPFSYYLLGDLKKTSKQVTCFSPIEKPDLIAAQNLYKKCFFQKFQNHLTVDRLKEGLRQLNSPQTWKGEVRHGFFSNGRLCAAIYGRKIDHPILKKPTFHIGFVAIDKEVLSEADCKRVKNGFLGLIHANNKESLPFSAKIDWFNLSSFYFFKKLGLVQCWISII